MSYDNDEEVHKLGHTSRRDLECLTIRTILEYRSRLAAAEQAEQKWRAAEEDSNISSSDREALRQSAAAANDDQLAYQLVVNDLVDRLGFFPKSPEDEFGRAELK